jgi:tRNA modification GTPase
VDRRFSIDDTIAAVATAPQGAVRGVVRLSGPDAFDIARSVFAPFPVVRSSPVASTGSLRLGAGYAEPTCEAFIWPAGRGYTRQPAVELHTIGSPPLLEKTMAALCAAGARPAGPGEFTLRAFLAGRLDLTQAEAVLGVIDAADRRQLDIGLAQLAGGIGRPLSRLRNRLLDLLAHLEAGLDFVDEDIEFIDPADLRGQLAEAAGDIRRLAAQLAGRSDSAAPPRVVLIGRPNVGKSRLFNSLTGGRALVSPAAGTTRDYLTAELDLGGMSCRLIDTAGRDDADGDVSAASQRLRREQQQAAELELLCLDLTRPLDDWERAEALAAGARRIVVRTKCDLESQAGNTIGQGLITSAATGDGLEALRDRIRLALVSRQDVAAVPSTAIRCGDSLRSAANGLSRAASMAAESAGDELIAAEVRLALDDLGHVVGAVYTDDLLDRIFSRFCIGK